MPRRIRNAVIVPAIISPQRKAQKRIHAKAFMARRRRQRIRPKRTRRTPPAMRVERHRVKIVIPYASTEGSWQRWFAHIKLSSFTKRFENVYSEFKITSLTARYHPNNSLNDIGLYAGVMLDRDGFGSYGAADASSWFNTIVAMPGSQVHPRYTASTYQWKPTEPSAREWRVKGDDYHIATVYLCNNQPAAATNSLGGDLVITATLLTRGLYYNAPVGVLESVGSRQIHGASTSSHCDFEEVEMEQLTPH